MYGMDKDADGTVDFAEIQAYEKYKAEMYAKAKANANAVEASKSGLKAGMTSDFDTVPGFRDRRGWHGNDVNHHQYAEPIAADTAVFPYNKGKVGQMASMLQTSSNTTYDRITALAKEPSGSPMEPRGRARTRGGGGIDSPIKFYEPNPLLEQSNAFDSRLFGSR